MRSRRRAVPPSTRSTLRRRVSSSPRSRTCKWRRRPRRLKTRRFRLGPPARPASGSSAPRRDRDAARAHVVSRRAGFSATRSTHDRLVRELADGPCTRRGVRRLRRSPEARFRCDRAVYASTRTSWIMHVRPSCSSSSRLAIIGDSVGGNMSAVVAFWRRSGRDRRSLTGMLYPVTDASLSEGSYATYENGPWLSKAMMAWFWDLYLPCNAKPDGRSRRRLSMQRRSSCATCRRP